MSQRVFTGEVLQPSDHLDTLKQVHIFLFSEDAELDPALQVGKGERQNSFLLPAAHAASAATQDEDVWAGSTYYSLSFSFSSMTASKSFSTRLSMYSSPSLYSYLRLP